MTIDIHRSARWTPSRLLWLVVMLAAVLLVSCGKSTPETVAADALVPTTATSVSPSSTVIVPPAETPTTEPPANQRPATEPPSTEPPVTEPPVTATGEDQSPDGPSPAAPTISAFLAPMGIDDRPQPWVGYDRADWPHWADTDGDGCDARQQALIAASITPAQVDFFRCTVIAGDWYSAYDGVSTDDPSSFDADHLVPLRDAHQSGGWRWTLQQRRLFANDQANLWVVSASSNRSKGARTPDQWRPPRTEAWCEFAIRWVQVKVGWDLTATTAERDALGSMLERCGELPPPPRRR